MLKDLILLQHYVLQHLLLLDVLFTLHMGQNNGQEFNLLRLETIVMSAIMWMELQMLQKYNLKQFVLISQKRWFNGIEYIHLFMIILLYYVMMMIL